MERSREYEDLAAALVALRPNPRPAFAAELDDSVATGFPRDSRSGRSPLSALAARVRRLSPQRLLFSGGATALAAIAIATVVVASLDSSVGPATTDHEGETRHPSVQFSKEVPRAQGATKESSTARADEDSSAAQASPESLPSTSSGADLALPSRTHRDIERSAEIGLLAEPADVADDSAQVFSAVHDAGGIVLHSTTTAGRHAGADFDLLIPSAKLGDALAAFSAIDEVRRRHEATTDITAPTIALGELLEDSRAKIDGLLAQLAATETESEREAVEIGLRHERHHAAVLRARLSKLQRRADYSRVSLRIETDDSATDSTAGSWGVDDAFHDAGHILGIAAGVTLIALAAIVPLALIALIAWLAYLSWLRFRRERALSGRV